MSLIDFQVYQAACSANLGSVQFNPISGYCELKNDYSTMVTDLYSLDFNCGSKPDTFNTLLQKCASGTSCVENCNPAPGKIS